MLLYNLPDVPNCTTIPCLSLLLLVRSENIWASFLNQPIEVAELRPKVERILDERGYPQVMMRMGYGQDTKPTPRRQVDEVLR